MADYSQIERELINKNKQYGEQQAQSMRCLLYTSPEIDAFLAGLRRSL